MTIAEPLDAFRPTRSARHEQIAAFLREQILSGAFAPDARLPPTQELTRRWGVPIATIQRAFAPLVKEGLLLRRPGFGTVVLGQAPVLTRVAIYQPQAIGWNGGDRFADRLADLVESRLAAGGRAALRVIDRRPDDDRGEPLPGLVRAVRSRQVDALIATGTNRHSTPWLESLPVPSAFYGSGSSPHEIWFDFPDFATKALDALAGRGCRRVGLITVLRPGLRFADGVRQHESDLHVAFLAGLEQRGLATRPEWIRAPAPGEDLLERDAERFGYEQIQALWASPERPDGLAVYTDRTARGVVMGLLATAPRAAPPHLVLHRNAELNQFCPLPADYLESSVAAVADRLIAIVEAQHGRRPMPRFALDFRLVPG